MAWTTDTFLQSYPEFAEERRVLVAAKLAEAARRVSATVWGTWTDDGVALLTAHLLALTPYPSAWATEGATKPVVTASGDTPYMVEFRRLARIVGTAARVIPHEDEDVD